MKWGVSYVCVTLSSMLVADAVFEEHTGTLLGSSLAQVTSYTDAFLGAEGRATAHSGTLQSLIQTARAALGIGASTMVVFVFLGVFAILVIAFATGKQFEDIGKKRMQSEELYNEWVAKQKGLQGMNPDLTALQRKKAQKEKELQDKTKKLSSYQELISTQQAELDAEKRTKALNQMQLKGLATEDKALIKRINSRKKVSYDPDTNLFKIVDPIDFVHVRVKPTQTTAPPAEFANPDAAHEVISDLAEILKTMKQTRCRIEGHTEGGDSAAKSAIGKSIAENRAEKVVKELVSMGISRNRLDFRGKPGSTGDNRADIKIIAI